MSDSDDDVPLNQRSIAAPKPEAIPVKKDDSDSEDDVPLAARKTEVPNTETKVKLEQKTRPVVEKKSKTPKSTTKIDGEKSSKPVAPKKKQDTAPSQRSQTTTDRVRKVYDKPGQTRDTPGEEDPLRRFYTSLLEQIPESEMAQKWCVMHGLMPTKEAEKWVQEQAKKKGSNKSPVKSGVRRPPTTPKLQKRKESDTATVDDDEDDFKKKPAKQKAVPTQKETSKPKKVTSLKDDDDKEVIPAAKKRTKSTPKGRKDVAFADGGMDSDSDDDVPLNQRMKS